MLPRQLARPVPVRPVPVPVPVPVPAQTPTGDPVRSAASSPRAPLTRVWRPGRPVDVHATLGSVRRGSGDPTYRSGPDGAVWRAVRTPEGPGTVRVQARGDEVCFAGWGPGAGWLVEHGPASLGSEDDPEGFSPRHPLLRRAAARHPGWRVPRTGLVLEALVPSVLEQKVTVIEARQAWRTLLCWYGEPAPGPAPQGMRLPPGPECWRRVPSWDWHRAGVDAKRSRAVLEACRVAARLEETLALTPGQAEARLTAVPGIGVWTAAEVRQRAHGDPDAVSVGDLHLCKDVGWALVGRPVDDEGLLELLEPYAGHRYRAVRLLTLAGLLRRPRFAPRFAPRDFRAI